jgi:type IV pilus assembly protein PilY1
MVYVGANDGMLHAFYASTGEEAWAYVPGTVLSRLFRLADKNYGAQNMHQFTVDGTPVVGDICVSDCATPASGSLPTVWKTILVGGLNNGGRGYYALDITDPAAPKGLWEFTHNDLGYSYGNPVITKLKDGTWVVIVTSGYNNISPGDGGGHLFIIRASDGTLLRTRSRPAPATPPLPAACRASQPGPTSPTPTTPRSASMVATSSATSGVSTSMATSRCPPSHPQRRCTTHSASPR